MEAPTVTMHESDGGRPGRAAASPELAELPARYRVLDRLGRGTHKSVYLADDTVLGRRVAVAALDASVLKRRFERLHEARAMARLGNHPHVVSVHDVIECDGWSYIVSQYLSGGDLAEHLDGGDPGKLAIPRVLQLGLNVCRALEHAHENGICHGDIKPTNVFLDERGDASLGDFGLAATPDVQVDDGPEIAGTPGYMAPEVLFGARGPRSDLYAFGCLLFELATGRLPFEGEDGNEILRMHQVAEPPQPHQLRKEIPRTLSQLILKLLEKKPDERPASARDVAAALQGILAVSLRDQGATDPADGREDRPLRVVPRPSSGAQLLGRAPEQRRLDAALTRAYARTPGVVLVEGHAGIGKSALVEEVRARAGASGGLALVGQAREQMTLPFQPLLEALLPLAARLVELPQEAQALLRGFLLLDPFEPRTREQLRVASAESRELLFAKLSEAIFQLSSPQPIVLILEDLHWADAGTLAFVEHMAKATAHRATEDGAPTLVVGTLRPVDADHPLIPILDGVAPLATTERLELAGLDATAVRDLIEDRGVERPSEQLVRLILEGSGGNPLFAGELLEHLARRGALGKRHGFSISQLSAAELRLPASVSEAIQERVSDLPDACRTLLATFAALGPVCELRDLAAIESLGAADVVSRLRPAIDSHVVIDDGGRFRFAHPLFLQQVYQPLAPSELQLLHLRIADHLEARDPAQVQQIASHLVRAGAVADEARLARFASEAADIALSQFAWRDAIELLTTAVSAGRGLAHADLGALHLKLAHAHNCLFDTGNVLRNFDEAIECFRRAGDRLQGAHATVDRIHASVQLGMGGFHDQSDDNADTLWALAEEFGTSDLELRTRILGGLAEIYFLRHDAARGRDLVTQAADLATRCGNDLLSAEIAIHAGLLLTASLYFDEALAAFRRGSEQAERAGGRIEAERCGVRVPFTLYRVGQLREALELAEAREARSTVDRPILLVTRAGIAGIQGDHAQVEVLTEEVCGYLQHGWYTWAGMMILPMLAHSRAQRGDPERAHVALDWMMTPGNVLADPTALSPFCDRLRMLIDAYAASEPGEVPTLEGDLEGFDSPRLGEEVLNDICARAELRFLATPRGRLGARQLTADERAAFAWLDEHHCEYSMGWPFFVPRLQGIAAALDGDLSNASARLDAAARHAFEIEAIPDAVRAQVDHATVLADRNAPGDRARALTLLDDAMPLFRMHGPSGLCIRAERLRGELEKR